MAWSMDPSRRVDLEPCEPTIAALDLDGGQSGRFFWRRNFGSPSTPGTAPATVQALAEYRQSQDVVSIEGLIFTYEDGKPFHPDG
jgi:hypothetical protein